jgi:hypothetical protein
MAGNNIMAAAANRLAKSKLLKAANVKLAAMQPVKENG